MTALASDGYWFGFAVGMVCGPIAVAAGWCLVAGLRMDTEDPDVRAHDREMGN